MKEYTKRSNLSLMQVVLGIVGIIGGIWMILAPFVLNYSGITILDAATKKQVPASLGAVTANDTVVGIVLIVLGLAALVITGSQLVYRLQMIATGGIIAAGIYLMVAPYLFDLLKVASYMGLDKPNTSDQLTGIVAVIVGGFAFQKQFLVAREDETGTLPAPVTI